MSANKSMLILLPNLGWEVTNLLYSLVALHRILCTY